jgi:phosphoribosyl-AMP cyclohydrolase
MFGVADRNAEKVRYDERGLVPCVMQDARSGEVLTLAYMNEEALRLTLETREIHLYSRSRNEIWHKGATSGEFQVVKEIRVDCDQDAIVLKVEQLGGGCCHTKAPTCFYRKVDLKNLGEGLVPLTRE